MELATAKQAGELAKAIETRVEMRAFVETAISEAWTVVDVSAVNPATGERRSLILSDLDNAPSQAGLGFIKQMYDAQISALETDLAAL